MGVKGLELLREAKEKYGLPTVTEVMSPNDVEIVAEYSDVLQIGARNMQNFALLNAVGESQKPVLLKRGMMSTIEELIMAAEYILSHGNLRVILCERGIRTFEPATRNTFDINAIPLLKTGHASPRHCGPQSWHRQMGFGHAGGAWRRCGRRGRIDYRSASKSRQSHERWRTIPQTGKIRRAGETSPQDRRSSRQDCL